MNDNGLPFNIRRLEAKDIPAVTSIDRLVFRDPWPESAYVQELYFNPNAHYFVLQLTPAMPTRSWSERRAALASQIIGFVGVRVEIDRGHISTLAIRPEWRGWSLGELLLHKALDQAIHHGAETVSLEVRVSNTIALNLYTKYGFEQVSRLRGYYSDGEDAYFMRADVTGLAYQQHLQKRYTMLIARFEPQVIGTKPLRGGTQ
ncbi:MAG TPA: ribosomal protein S18-alanine N-acetyltransferase [Anaerolineae bacterium]|nr:ribosomal protein S18-alanine N-acetyltransferase [Anaerolineae bacterium]HQI87523.1 ribosomal protein S18-alanine N-acetyltransferase [Anaerolineae bacterium]